MTDIFLSYNREDQATARLFAESFERAGFRVWWDVSLKSGEAYDRVTEQALRDAKAVVVLWSPRSVNSDWVRAEATIALRNKTLTPVMIEPCERPIMFELTQTADLCHWKGDSNDKAWLNFVGDVQRFVGKERVPVQVSESVTLKPFPKFVAPMAVAVVVVLAAVLFILQRDPGTAPAESTAPTDGATTVATTSASQSVVTAEPSAKSLAVLPFSNLSADADQAYFADGLTDELINTLVGVDGLQVTGRASAFYFKDSALPLAEIASMLGVSNVLQGSVRKAGNELRITVQLTAIESGFTLWSQNFDRQLDDIFMVQEEIATAVATALSVTLGAGDFAQPGMTRNVAAYDAYLQGRSAFATYSQQSLLDGMVKVEAAVQLDPDFALAWFLLGDFHANARAMLPAEQTAGFRESARDAFAKATALAPDMRGLMTRSLEQLWSTDDFLGAEQLLQQEMARYGLDATTNIDFARQLLHVGRFREALVYAERARRQDPYSFGIARDVANVLAANLQYGEARREIERGLMLSEEDTSSFYATAAVLEMADNNWAAALEATSHLSAVREAQTRIINEVATGDSAAGVEYLRQLLTDRSVAPIVIGSGGGIFAAVLGEPELALEIFDSTGLNQNTSRLLNYRFFDTMRRLLGFKTLVEKEGLLTYWRSTGNWADYCRPLPTTESDFECF